MQVLERRHEVSALPEFARGPVSAVAGVLAAALLAVSGRYGYFGDELYFIAAGRHLDWGYADQGPLLPLLAWLMDSLAPGSLTVLHLPSVLFAVATTVVTALLARELGGQRRAQFLAALVCAGCPFTLGNGHLASTNGPDVLMWALAGWLLVRWVRTRADGVLLWLGPVTAVALQAKFLIVGFWLAAGLAALVFGPRDLLTRPKLWLAAGFTVLVTLPSLWWQAGHGWPQLGMTGQIAGEGELMSGGALGFLPFALFTAGLLTGVVLLVFGLLRLLRAPALRPYAFLGWAFLGVVALFLATGGRPYYVCGLFPVLWAAGAVEASRLRLAAWWRWSLTVPAALVSAAAMVFIGLPLRPVESAAGRGSTDFIATHSVGWEELADQVAAAHRNAPPGTAVITNGYWTASALAYFGPARGLPDPYSRSRGYWYFGTPPESAHSVLFVGRAQELLARNFTEVRQVGVVDTRLGGNTAAQDTPLYLATGRTRSWARLWPEMRKLA
ncbi:4-amino-4-deoxy-L-arabinose transferase-like glycosyltransferase [Crossiella equi]|uniref:4-amino-4-deoxy-L-arabinose transferase-like glycosyltransferase n=1 Tax=Crossiella equi TaxID=130796 RepID=A0ABS5ACD7_9PSEU|nr:glycosyltransferase family 39 protein [Crossiella equi]MBP2473967.1 4-amino-4-deoxy-L-arabinose transferase-like glycosyltransferase [Crossiella equi]